MKILFLLRIDASSKNGGDLIQAKKYKEVIHHQINGAMVHFSFEISQQELLQTKWTYVVCFNLVRLQEYAYLLKKISYKKAILVPIIFPQFNFTCKNNLKSIYRSFYQRQYATVFKICVNPEKYLNLFDGFVFLSARENESFVNKFGHRVKENATFTICHNGIDYKQTGFTSYLKANKERDIDFVVVGRIETQKNSLAALEFRNTYFKHKSIVFIGAKNPYHKKYAQKFIELVSLEDAKYVGAIKHHEVIGYLQRAKIILNLSLLEVSPLVDLEALSQGCKVVTTSHSFTHLVNSNNILVVNPDNLTNFVPQIQAMLDCDFDVNDKQFENWETTLIPLINILKND